MKSEKKAGQTSIDTHPTRAPKGKTSRQGPDHRTLSIQPLWRETATFAGRARVKKVLTVGQAEDMKSSTRVGSVAPLRNTKEDDYYRNDSMK